MMGLLICCRISSEIAVPSALPERKKPSPEMTEEQLQQVTVGELKPHEAPITMLS